MQDSQENNFVNEYKTDDTFSIIVGVTFSICGLFIVLVSLSIQYWDGESADHHRFTQITGASFGVILLIIGLTIKALQPFRSQEKKRKESDKNWELVNAEVKSRVELLEEIANKFSDITPKPKNPLTIAATEIFVAKAQDVLTSRAMYLSAAAGICTIATALILGVTSYHLYTTEVPEYFTKGNINTTLAVIYLIKTTTASALAIGVATMCGTLSFSFLHEAMVLYSRRHALRFGRLYVYMKDGANIPFKDLQQAFRWNDEFSTGFKKMEIGTPLSKTQDAVNTTLTSVAKNLRFRKRATMSSNKKNE